VTEDSNIERPEGEPSRDGVSEPRRDQSRPPSVIVLRQGAPPGWCAAAAGLTVEVGRAVVKDRRTGGHRGAGSRPSP
jgi:hypothetical protein